MHLLDCGCGPGSITGDLAAAVGSGEAVGIDVEPAQIAAARAAAGERNALNVRFEVADVYALPYEPSSFDAVFAHGLLMHLRDPLTALREMRRVLRPSGVIGISDPDFGAWLCVPSAPLLEEANALFLRVLEHNGASPYYARGLRGHLAEAGFVDARGGAYTVSYGDPDALATPAWVMEHYLSAPAFVDAAEANGWADKATLRRMIKAFKLWSRRDDAFYAMLFCSAVARVPEE